MIYIKFLVLFCNLLKIFAWDLSNYNISSKYYVSSVIAYGTRAFLTLPRCSCHNNITNPTLVEAVFFNEQSNFFVRKKPFFIDFQQWNKCNHLQDAISIDMEIIRSRLWILDKGNSMCPPKIVIYNLFHKINYTSEVPIDHKEKLNSLIIDNDKKLNGARAYIGIDGANYILIFSLSEFKWWQLNLKLFTNTLVPISTKFLALSRKEPILYITGSEERAIFSLNLHLIRKQFTEDHTFINISYLGEKLGSSSALVSDLKDGLSYYLPRDYVVVRWDTSCRYASQAENYNILAQSYKQLPYVSQLYTDPQNGIWALVNYGDINNCQEDNSIDLKRRLVKLLKYNILM